MAPEALLPASSHSSAEWREESQCVRWKTWRAPQVPTLVSEASGNWKLTKMRQGRVSYL